MRSRQVIQRQRRKKGVEEIVQQQSRGQRQPQSEAPSQSQSRNRNRNRSRWRPCAAICCINEAARDTLSGDSDSVSGPKSGPQKKAARHWGAVESSQASHCLPSPLLAGMFVKAAAAAACLEFEFQQGKNIKIVHPTDQGSGQMQSSLGWSDRTFILAYSGAFYAKYDINLRLVGIRREQIQNHMHFLFSLYLSIYVLSPGGGTVGLNSIRDY